MPRMARSGSALASVSQRRPALEHVVAGVRLGGDGAEPAGLEVLEGLDQLVPGVHHERAVRGDRLADRLAAEDQDVQPVAGAVVAAAGRRW